MKDLKRRGVSIIFISHALEEALQTADRITVLRDGELVITDRAIKFDRDKIVRAMVGRTLSNELVHEELAAALGVERSRGKTVGGFSRQIQSYDLDERISNQEAVCNLNPFGIRSPMFLNRPRHEHRTDDYDRGTDDPLASDAPSTPGAVRLIVPGSLQPRPYWRRSDG